MAKKGNQRNNRGRTQQRRTQRANRIRERATTDVQLMDQPQVDLQNAMLQQAQEDYLRELQTARSTYGGAADAIRGIETPDFGGIADQLQGWMNGLAPEFGGGGYTGFSDAEAAAGQGYGGALAGASLGSIAGDIERAQAAQAGAQRAAVVGGQNVEDNVIQRMEDTMQQYRNTLQNIRADDPWQIKSRTDELTDQALEQKLARSKMQGDRAFNEWLADYMGGQLGGGRMGGRGPGGGGGGGGGQPHGNNSGAMDRPGQGTVSHAAIDNQNGINQLGVRGRVNMINNMDDYNSVPSWLQQFQYSYPHGGPAAWRGAQDLAPRKRQIWRQTRGHVRDLYREEYPWANGGGQ